MFLSNGVSFYRGLSGTRIRSNGRRCRQSMWLDLFYSFWVRSSCTDGISMLDFSIRKWPIWA